MVEPINLGWTEDNCVAREVVAAWIAQGTRALADDVPGPSREFMARYLASRNPMTRDESKIDEQHERLQALKATRVARKQGQPT